MPYQKLPTPSKEAKRAGGRSPAEKGAALAGEVSYRGRGDDEPYLIIAGKEVWVGPALTDEMGRPVRVKVVVPPGSGARQDFGPGEAPVQVREEASKPADDPLVSEAVAAVLERVPEIVRARQEKLSEEHIDLLVDAYLKSAPTAAARHSIELDNARERARFREEFPCYTSRELAELAGHGAGNVSATATRWKKARRIIGLPWKDGDLYPAFQFSEGRPRPIVARLLAALPGRMTPWQTAFWLTSSNSWLGGATPVDRFDDESALLAAATRESEALTG